MQTREEKGNYLIGQAKGFLDAKKYAGAQVTAQQIIEKYQAKAEEAKKVLAEATEKAMANAIATSEKATEDASKAVEGLKEGVGNLGK